MNNKALILDLVEWLAARPRSYEEAMRAWRTSCPKLPIWEDAVDLGFICADVMSTLIRVTPAGETLLRLEGRLPRSTLAGQP